MKNVQPYMPHGSQMPAGWQQAAPLIAKQATEDYLSRLQNAWRQPLTKTNDSQAMAARLRPTTDARIDALHLTANNDEEERWEAPGVTVRKKKR